MIRKILILIFVGVCTLGLCVVAGGTPNEPTYGDSVTASTKNLFGINCMMQVIHNLEDSASFFSHRIKLCGPKVEENALRVLYDTSVVTTYISGIRDMNTYTCNNANYLQDSDAQKTPSTVCASEIQNAMKVLKNSIDSTTTDVDTYLGASINVCASMSLLSYKFSLLAFPMAIETCGQLSQNVTAALAQIIEN